MRVSALAFAVLALLAVSVGCRTLLADKSYTPPECSGWRREWSSTEIDCKVCDTTLECEVHGNSSVSEFFGRQKRIGCEIDSPDYDFECPLVNDVYTCDWEMLKNNLTGCLYNATLTLLTAWPINE